MKRQLHLNLFIHSRGHHEASWRHPVSSPLALTDIRYYQDLAQRAEAGLFDSHLPGRPAGARRRRGAGGAHLARAGHGAGGGRGCHQPDRADRHLPRPPTPSRSTWRGSSARWTTSATAASAGTSSRPGWRPAARQLRRRRPGQPRRPLRPGRRVHDRGQGAVGQLGRGRGARRPRRRALRARRPHPADQPPGRALQGGRAAQPAALAAGPAGAGAGRLVRHRPPLRRAARRGGVHRAHGEGDGAGVLRRPQGAGGGRGARARAGADPARPEPDDRLAPRPRRSAWRARSTSCPIRRSGGSGCPAGSADTTSRTCRSTGRSRRRISPTPARCRPRAAAPR